ncbi:MAG: tRNA preQ1(34) S-adenosylmethionine ribosyltransferase-isomerase QueA [Spirochaetales bacterium]|nr:tRNA preQ1(34) S-adenosylmethionine ribosyltransferase-isomerase QueA [Spirochaetales bacterium]
MKTSDFSFDLPEHLVAQQPPTERGTSRLMVLDRNDSARHHGHVADIRDFVEPGSLMVFNNSRVRKARLYGVASDSHSRQEFLLVRRRSARSWLAIGRNARRLRVGKTFTFSDGVVGEITDVVDPYREITFNAPVDNGWLDRYGNVPLPPYIHREDSFEDAERYQTVYAATVGSVAAPTAGLHFTPRILGDLRRHGVTIRFITLHVGIGTFLPVRSETLEEHRMHEEEFYISPEVSQTVASARRDGHPVIAVGTTVVRTLESAWDDETGALHSGYRSTDLFIYPGFSFRVVDQLFTNFHTPGSTLVALVSAFAGREFILESYREAVAQRYRFFSYGDAMLIR